MSLRLKQWDGDIPAARLKQSELSKELILRDQFARPLRTIAGFHVAVEDDGAPTLAAAVLLDADTLEVLDQQVARLPTTMPRIPGLLSFHALPALFAVLERLKHLPDLAFLDGHGIAHPQRLGMAAHFGVLTGLPSIGVATEILIGTSITNLHDMRGAFTPLRDGRKQIGWLLRSKVARPPLVVSPGHKVALASSPELVMRYIGNGRLPEPTRLAVQLAGRNETRASSSP